ncbi:MAG TPA: hypothetical protein VNE71_02795 [Myxococcota bacterium]|nr:hypothetical protein [Myxococcota bacterium]
MRLARLAALALPVTLAACSTPAPVAAPPGASAAAEEVALDAPISLFPGDAEILSDDAIARILDAPDRLPKSVRLALLHIEHRSASRFWGWGPFWTTIGPSAQQALTTAIAGRLEASPRVSTVALLPTFLLPERPGVGHLREAGARFRADAILVYRTDCQAYERHRAFRVSRAKAFCSAETALLDVRTGIVDYATRSLRDFEVPQQSSDANFLETVRNAETQAYTAALEENAKSVVGYFGEAP